MARNGGRRMTAKEYDGFFSDGVYVVGSYSSANNPSAIRSMLFHSNEQNKNYVKKCAHIWKRNNVFYYRVITPNTDVKCNGFAYSRTDGKPSPFANNLQFEREQEETI